MDAAPGPVTAVTISIKFLDHGVLCRSWSQSQRTSESASMPRHCEFPTQTFVDRIQLARVVRMFGLPPGGRGNIGARGLQFRRLAI